MKARGRQPEHTRPLGRVGWLGLWILLVSTTLAGHFVITWMIPAIESHAVGTPLCVYGLMAAILHPARRRVAPIVVFALLGTLYGAMNHGALYGIEWLDERAVARGLIAPQTGFPLGSRFATHIVLAFAIVTITHALVLSGVTRSWLAFAMTMPSFAVVLLYVLGPWEVEEYLFLGALHGGWCAALLRWAFVARRDLPKHLCPSCGYDLRGLPPTTSKCPECGLELRHQDSPQDVNGVKQACAKDVAISPDTP